MQTRRELPLGFRPAARPARCLNFLVPRVLWHVVQLAEAGEIPISTFLGFMLLALHGAARLRLV